MTLDADILIDRRRLRRRLSFWRVLAILAIVAAIVAAIARSGSGAFGEFSTDHIARVAVSGFIGDSRKRHELLDKLRNNDNVKAVIVAVDSPGGTTAGGEALYEDLRELAKTKPVAAVFGTAATSAAYLAGIATDYIVARGNTITGSVGVIFQWAEVSDLLSKLGVKVDEVRSGPLKAQPSPFTPTDEAAKRLTEELVKEFKPGLPGLFRNGARASRLRLKTSRLGGFTQAGRRLRSGSSMPLGTSRPQSNGSRAPGTLRKASKSAIGSPSGVPSLTCSRRPRRLLRPNSALALSRTKPSWVL